MRKIAGNVSVIVCCSAMGHAVRQSGRGFGNDFVGFGENVMSASEPAMTAVIARKRETNEFLAEFELTEG